MTSLKNHHVDPCLKFTGHQSHIPGFRNTFPCF
uniref:Uncharacterized protein n=1 Tax=Anguilla anguilla TaxID=7936 RepID=A0A0E9P9B3_ANGAN